jgi:hypothetical protein
MTDGNEYLVHISELTLDVEKADLTKYFDDHGISNITVPIIKQ